jgi:hypothetical protein
MRFLGGYDAMLIYGVEGRFVPALKKAATANEFLKTGKPPLNLATFTDTRVKTLPLMPEWNPLNREVWNAPAPAPNLNKIWNKEAPVKDVATELARLSTEYIKGREQY